MISEMLLVIYHIELYRLACSRCLGSDHLRRERHGQDSAVVTLPLAHDPVAITPAILEVADRQRYGLATVPCEGLAVDLEQERLDVADLETPSSATTEQSTLQWG